MCKCVETTDLLLAEHNTQIEPIFTFGSRTLGTAVGIRTTKVDKKKRGQPKTVIASFCPFCGNRLR